jgi:hypothetical protein
MLSDAIKTVFRSCDTANSFISEEIRTLQCNLKIYSPYLKKNNKYVSLYGIFDDGAFGPLNKLLITGNKGVGKTTLLKSILHNWSMQTLWDDRFDLIYMLDLQLLLDGDWMCSYENYDIDDPTILLRCLIHYTMFGMFDEKELSNLGITPKDLIIPDNDKLLLLVDGYSNSIKELDDFNLVSSVIFQCKNIITVADPKSIKLEDEKKYDSRLEHLGISDTGIAQYQKDYFDSTNSLFSEVLDKNEWIRDFCRMPVHLFIFCYIYSDNEYSNNKTISDVYFNFIKKFTNLYLEKNWMDSRKRGSEFANTLHKIFALSATRLSGGTIKAKKSEDGPSVVSIEDSINYLMARHDISPGKGGIVSLKKIHDYGLLVPEKASGVNLLETELQNLDFHFNPWVIEDYFFACNIVYALLGNDTDAQKDIYELINTQKYSNDYLRRFQYAAGIFRIISESPDDSKFFLGLDVDQEIINRASKKFWNELTKNIYSDYKDPGIYQRVITLMSLLSQVSVANEPNNIIPEQKKLVEFIDIIVLYQFLSSFTNSSEVTTEKWIEDIRTANYISDEMRALVLYSLSQKSFDILCQWFSSIAAAEFKELHDHFKEELNKRKAKPIDKLLEKITVSSLQIMYNNWDQFSSDSLSISQKLIPIFDEFKGKSASWEVISAAMKCQLKIGGPTLDYTSKLVETILDKSSLSDVDIRFISMIAGTNFEKEGSTRYFNPGSIVACLLPKRNLIYQDMYIGYVSEFLKHTNNSDGLWEDIMDELCKYYTDKDAFTRLCAVKSSTILTSNLKYEDSYEDILDKLIKMTSDPSEGVRLVVVSGLFDIIGGSSNQDMIEEYLPTLENFLADEVNYVKLYALKGISNILLSLPVDTHNNLIEEYLIKLINYVLNNNLNIQNISPLLVTILNNKNESLIQIIFEQLDLLFCSNEKNKQSYAIEFLLMLVRSGINIGQHTGIEELLPKLKRIIATKSDNDNSLRLLAIKCACKLLLLPQTDERSLVEEYLPELINYLSDKEVKESLVKHVSSLLLTLPDSYRESFMEEYLPILLKYLADEDLKVMVSSIQAIDKLILYDSLSEDALEDSLNTIFKALYNYVSMIEDNIRLPVVDLIAELIVKLSLRDKRDFPNDYDFILGALYDNLLNDNSNIKVSSMNCLIAISAIKKDPPPDMWITRLLPLLAKYFADENEEISLAAINGACAISVHLLPQKISEFNDYILEELLPRMLECFLSETINILPIKYALIKISSIDNDTSRIVLELLRDRLELKDTKTLLSIIDTMFAIIINSGNTQAARDFLDEMEEHFSNSSVSSDIIKTSTKLVVELKDTQLAKNLLNSLQRQFDNEGNPTISLSAVNATTELVVEFKDTQLAKDLLSSLQRQFDNEDNPTISLNAINAATKLVSELKDPELAKNLLSSLQRQFDNEDNPTISLNAINAATKLVSELKDPELAKNLISSLQRQFDNEDNPTINLNAINAATNLVTGLKDPELAKNLISSLQRQFDNEDNPTISLNAINAATNLVTGLKDPELAKNLISCLQVSLVSDDASIRARSGQVIQKIKAIQG